jgi:hypothetical protein
MGLDLHIYGGFNISPYIAMRVFEIVDEINAQNTDLSLSHVDDDDCEVCRGAPREEPNHDAALPDLAGHRRVA